MRTYVSILAPEIQNYIKNISESGQSIQNHELHLGNLDRYLCSINHNTKEINESVATEWLKSKNATTNYQRLILCYYRGFSRYLKAHGINAFVPDSPYAEHTYIPHIFTDEEVKSIFSVCDDLTASYGKDRSPLMMSMLLRLLYGTGMRLGEALHLNVHQVDFDAGCILLLKAKNNRERWIPLHPQLMNILEQYTLALGINGKSDFPLFPNDNNSYFTNAWAQRWFKIIVEKAGLSLEKPENQYRGICLHCFRHSYAFRALKQAAENGMSFEEAAPFISTYLGHKNISATDYYLRFGYTLFEEEQRTFSAYTSGMFPEVENG